MPMGLRIENAEKIREEVGGRIAQVRALLAEPLSRIDELANDESGTHPLVEVLAAAERWIADPESSSLGFDRHVVEAMGLAPLIEARKSDPALQELLAGMVESSQYIHAVGVLGTAFAMQGMAGVQRIELVQKASGTPGRIPDIRVLMGEGQAFNIEAKAPRRLRGLDRRLRPNRARHVVQTAVSEAAHPERGQLPTDSPGIVAIAAHGLRGTSIDELARASKAVLRRHGSEDFYLMGVLLVNFYYEIRHLRTSVALGGWDDRRVTHTVQVAWGSHRELVPNRSYRGSFKIESVEGFDPAQDGFDLSLP